VRLIRRGTHGIEVDGERGIRARAVTVRFGSVAAACTGGNCPAANLVVTGIVSPQSAGTTKQRYRGGRTAAGVRATGYTGTIHFTSTDGQAVLPANYTFTSSTAATPNCTSGCDQGIHTFTNGVVLKTAATQSVTATDTSSRRSPAARPSSSRHKRRPASW